MRYFQSFKKMDFTQNPSDLQKKLDLKEKNITRSFNSFLYLRFGWVVFEKLKKDSEKRSNIVKFDFS